MSVEDVVARVVEVLERVESLFAAPSDSAISGAAESAKGAAEASRAIAAHTEDFGGDLASAHRDVLTEVADRLDRAADTDAALADHIAHTGHTHAAGASVATDLRAGAQDIPAELGRWADVPAGELAGLIALRSRVADMQRLLTDHTGEAARTAEAIRSLGYQ